MQLACPRQGAQSAALYDPAGCREDIRPDQEDVLWLIFQARFVVDMRKGIAIIRLVALALFIFLYFSGFLLCLLIVRIAGLSFEKLRNRGMRFWSAGRSEERRVGKECRCRGASDQEQ